MSRSKSLLSRDHLRTLDPTVYERAAKRIEARDNTFSCLAIRDVVGWSNCYEGVFQAAFRGDVAVSKHPFWNQTFSKRAQNERYTALLMMAAMVRSAKASRGVKKPKAPHFQDRAALIGPGSLIGLSFNF